MVYHNPGSASPTPKSAPPNRNFITLIINEISSSMLTSLLFKKQKLEIEQVNICFNRAVYLGESRRNTRYKVTIDSMPHDNHN